MTEAPTYTIVALGTDQKLPHKEVARLLGTSGTPIGKAIAAGILPDRRLPTVAAAASISVLTSAIAANGAPLPVLRVGPSRPDDDDPTRSTYGFSMTQSNNEMLAGCDRWWTPQGSQLLLSARATLVACGSFSVGLLDIDGIRKVDQESGRCWYNATLVARWMGLDGGVHVLDRTSPNASLACRIVGLRVLGGQGGTITSL